jgi:hypothetical protein
MWARKNKNRPVSGFFTKTAYVQIMNFIPVKVSTLYLSNLVNFTSLFQHANDLLKHSKRKIEKISFYASLF